MKKQILILVLAVIGLSANAQTVNNNSVYHIPGKNFKNYVEHCSGQHECLKPDNNTEVAFQYLEMTPDEESDTIRFYVEVNNHQYKILMYPNSNDAAEYLCSSNTAYYWSNDCPREIEPAIVSAAIRVANNVLKTIKYD